MHAPEWIRAAALSEVPPGKPHPVRLKGHTIALFQEDGGLRAVDNRCPHMGFPLHKGTP